ncbi:MULTISPECIES: type IX secretion system sortase PorU [Flavobacterium]|uniref:type IX secretion system sortase PorU n=1 Tax=Flavobacterium TaxID=237 RepID=UPI001FCB7BCE|nr:MULTISPECIES: type IX secretion system sortase PorU [Flavobacterium]UOK43625.1 type IX secretion system sortase PorU [Flavobacterium enshiense]
MKKCLLLILIFVSFVGFSQQKEDVIVEWKSPSKYYIDTIPFFIPQFKQEHLEFNPIDKVLTFKKRFSVQYEVDEKSLLVSNVVYETVSKEDLKDLSFSKLPTKLNAAIDYIVARDLKSVLLSFSPIIKEGNVIKRVKSLSVSFSPDANSGKSEVRRNPIVNSVLASGNWYRFYVEKSGIYKLSRSFLQQMGFDVNVDPRRIKIYGNGGRMIPLLNSVPYPMDLAENAIQVIGESDGSFDNNDYVIFYAEGVDVWNDDSDTSVNLYDSKTYYYVTSHGGEGKRIALNEQPVGSPDMVFADFDDYKYHEVDKTNVAKLGRKWVGENFNIENVQSFSFSFPNIVISVPVKIKVNAVSASFGRTAFKISANSSSLTTMDFPALSPTEHVGGYESVYGGVFSSSSSNVSIQLEYDNGGVPSSNGYLDNISLVAKRKLQGYGKQFLFRNDLAGTNFGIGEYQLSSAGKISQVWDVTDIYNVSKVVNSGQPNFSFKSTLGDVRKYVALDVDDIYTPPSQSGERIANQNLKGTIFNDAQGIPKDIDYLIVTPSRLKAQAEKLAEFHRNYSKLNVKVVDLGSIYQEFSSGKQDIGAIRNFVKYIYTSYPTFPAETGKIKYLNLFGDASYDYKNRIVGNTNVVPVFQALYKVAANSGTNSLNFSNFMTFMSDDFYGLMGDDEGTMTSVKGVDVAVGRMLVNSPVDADQMVNKVFEYHNEKSYGRWRNKFVIISDDIDKQGDEPIQRIIDVISDDLYDQKQFVNVKKIHSDSYVQVTAAGGERYPSVNTDFVNEFESGGLVFNYFGHGGEDGLAQERIFEKTTAQNLKNRYRYPLFITITCEFTRFDNPSRPTAGEYMYWNIAGGAISLVTTTREITLWTGKLINEALTPILYGLGPNNEVSIAEALRQAKNQVSQSDQNVAFYVGDPALKLAIPKPKIKLTKINDVPVTQPTDTLEALSYVKISGEVVDESDNLQSDYNGDLMVQIFDKDIDRRTLGNDGALGGNGQLDIMEFKTLGETIFRGNASVTNGLFEFGFVVPRDIKIPVGTGRVSFYAKKNGTLVDNTGHDLTVKVGGINENAVADNLPPKIRLYMNDDKFVSGGITNASPIFLAFLDDEHGINTASGIGHDIVAILDGNENKPYILNDYFETDPNDYTKGKVRYPFRNLAKGLHTLTLKVWDVYNNFSTAEIQFIVMGDENVELSNVLNYPNPFVNYTEFWFSHNRPFESLDVQVQIMTITGKVVKTINQSLATEGFLSRSIKWDGRDDFGDKIGKGVYVYKLTVKSLSSNKTAEKIEKLVIL